MPPNPYVNYTGTPSIPIKQATTKRLLPDGTATLSAAYQLLMPENAMRRGFDIEAAAANVNTMFVRFGTTGPEYEITGGGSGMSRNKSTGDVFNGEIYVKGTAGQTFIAEEH